MLSPPRSPYARATSTFIPFATRVLPLALFVLAGHLTCMEQLDMLLDSATATPASPSVASPQSATLVQDGAAEGAHATSCNADSGSIHTGVEGRRRVASRRGRSHRLSYNISCRKPKGPRCGAMAYSIGCTRSSLYHREAEASVDSRRAAATAPVRTQSRPTDEYASYWANSALNSSNTAVAGCVLSDNVPPDIWPTIQEAELASSEQRAAELAERLSSPALPPPRYYALQEIPSTNPSYDDWERTLETLPGSCTFVSHRSWLNTTRQPVVHPHRQPAHTPPPPEPSAPEA